MSDHSSIEWTDATWNPVRGCTKISPGCAHCYAETFAERFRGVPGHPYEQGFDLRLVPEKLAEPLRWRRRAVIFVNSMSDLFHEDVPDDYILTVVARHAARQLAHLPGADQALRADARPAAARSCSGRAESRTSGGASASRTASTACRGSTTSGPLRRPSGSCRSSRCSKTSASFDLSGHPLGDRRRRERPRRAPARGVVGSRSATSAGRRASRSSSSSGADGRRRGPDGSSTAGPTTRSPATFQARPSIPSGTGPLSPNSRPSDRHRR